MLQQFVFIYAIITVFIIESIVYIWAAKTATFTNGNYFAIPKKLIFEKCSRNSGRISSIIHVIILCSIVYFQGLQSIYKSDSQFQVFFCLCIVFTTNHLIHFYFLSQNFKKQTMAIKMANEKHGIFTFVCISIFPIVLYIFQELQSILYWFIILHLLNVCFVFIDVFYNKIRVRSAITIHNKTGIIVTSIACIAMIIMELMKQLS